MSVRPPIWNAYRSAYSSIIINSGVIICISGERAWHPLQENEATISKNYFLIVLDRIFEKVCCNVILLLKVECERDQRSLLEN